VHLLAANGTKVPVTLKMSTKEDSSTGHLAHVVQVRAAGLACDERAVLVQECFSVSASVCLPVRPPVCLVGRVISINTAHPRCACCKTNGIINGQTRVDQYNPLLSSPAKPYLP
jgi:hypothetical protein